MDSETRRFIREEIKRELNVILSGEAGSNTALTEEILNLFPGMPGTGQRPLMLPYGFASRAPRGTIQVTAKQGDHPGNRLVLGHRDKDRPDTLESGESAQYSSGGYQIRVLNGKIELGKGGTWEPAVLGDKLTAVLIAVIDAIVAHKHMGNLGAETTPPLNAADFTGIKSGQVEGDKLLTKDGGGF